MLRRRLEEGPETLYIAAAPDARLAFERIIEYRGTYNTGPWRRPKPWRRKPKTSQNARWSGTGRSVELGESLDTTRPRPVSRRGPLALQPPVLVRCVIRQTEQGRETGKAKLRYPAAAQLCAAKTENSGALRGRETTRITYGPRKGKRLRRRGVRGDDAPKPPAAAHLEPELEASLRSALESATCHCARARPPFPVYQ